MLTSCFFDGAGSVVISSDPSGIFGGPSIISPTSSGENDHVLLRESNDAFLKVIVEGGVSGVASIASMTGDGSVVSIALRTGDDGGVMYAEARVMEALVMVVRWCSGPGGRVRCRMCWRRVQVCPVGGLKNIQGLERSERSE